MMHARCACSRTPGPCMNLCASVSLFQDPFHGFGNAHLLAPNTLLLVCEEPNSSITRNALRRCPRMARANIHQKAPSFLTKLRYALVYAKAYLCRGNAAPFLLKTLRQKFTSPTFFYLSFPLCNCVRVLRKPQFHRDTIHGDVSCRRRDHIALADVRCVVTAGLDGMATVSSSNS